MGATRVTREAGVLDSIDSLYRNLGYFTKGTFARFFVSFTLFTTMSEGLRERKLRCHQLSVGFCQLSMALRDFRDNGEVDDQMVGIMSEECSWLFQ